jgi:hypothetical protein
MLTVSAGQTPLTAANNTIPAANTLLFIVPNMIISFRKLPFSTTNNKGPDSEGISAGISFFCQTFA